MKIYLDNAATTAKKPISVYKKLIEKTIFSSVNAGRGTYRASLSAASDILDTQEAAAELFNISDASRIAFTQNATYALNTAIAGFVNKGEHIVITGIEHNSVLRPVYRLGNFTVAKADEKGNVTAQSIKDAIRPDTKLVAVSHASNVCGSVSPIGDITEAAHSVGAKVLIDAAQTAGIIDIDVSSLGIDMLAFSGHKGLMGPLGTGGLYVDEKITLRPLVTGGTGSMSESFLQPEIMPDMLHSGTQNTPAIAALGSGIDFVSKHKSEIYEKETELAGEFIEGLLNVTNAKIFGNLYKNRNATVAFNIGNLDCIEVAAMLEEVFGIQVRAGFHCSPLTHKTLGTQKTGCVRASFGFFNKKSDVKKILAAINKIQKNGYN